MGVTTVTQEVLGVATKRELLLLVTGEILGVVTERELLLLGASGGTLSSLITTGSDGVTSEK